MSGYLVIISPETGERRQLETEDEKSSRFDVEDAMYARLRDGNIEGSVRTFLVTSESAARLLQVRYAQARKDA